jgi:replicative superfamily II helicase
MSEAEYATLDHLESVCSGLRAMIRTTEEGALQDVQLGDLVSCLYMALDSAVVARDEYQSRAEAESLEELDYCEAV